MTTDTSKVIVTDIDGTLLDYRTELPASAAQAIVDARSAGHRAYVSTGRSLAELPKYILDLGFNGMILGNGSYIEHEGEVVHKECLPVAVADRAIAWLESQELGFYIESNDGLFGNEHLVPKTARMLASKEGYSDSVEENEEWLKTVMAPNLYDESVPHDNINKISFLLEPGVDLDDLARQYAGEAAISTWNITGEGEEFGEFGQVGVNKGRGLRILANHLGKSLNDFVALGDAAPDAPLLETAGTGVAMGNAPEELKEIADLVTDHVDDDGFAKALRQLGLTESEKSKGTSSEREEEI